MAVAVLGGEAGPGAALAHLTGCRDCRAALGWLGELVRVADMETPYANSLAALA